jgi:hypothetical protein
MRHIITSSVCVASDLTLFLPTAVKHILSNEDKGTTLEQLIDQFLMNFT